MGYHIVFVEPQFTGNIGFLARTMKNFGFDSMILVSPPEFDDDVYRFSKHARDVVENAIILSSFSEVRDKLDYLVATSGVDTASPKKFKRIAHTPREMAEKLSAVDGEIGVVFGRENYGLYNEEIEQCDSLVTIPTSPEYPIMNITHAAAVVLYEIHMAEQHSTHEMPLADSKEVELLNRRFAELLDTINFPEHKIKNAEVMFRRLVGRAMLTKWEYHSLMGVFSRTLYALRHRK